MIMKTFRIILNETIAYSVLVEAETEDDAREVLHNGGGTEPFDEWTVETFVVDVEEE
jgi:hypothetical protein